MTIPVPLVDGSATAIDIPAGTQPGTVFRMSRQGMPRLQRRGRGDLLVEVDVVVPTDLTADETTLLQEFAEQRGEDPGSGKRRKRRRRNG